MSTSTAHVCPDCNAEISPELRACVRCGADAFFRAESQRTPLILPGNPALSADVVRKRTSVPAIIVGATLSLALLGAVLYYMPARDTEEPATMALAAAPEPATPLPPAAPVVAAFSPPTPAAEMVRADSLAAFTDGNTRTNISVDATPPLAVSRSDPASAAPAPADAVSLALTPLVSNILDPGDRVQLRSRLIDRRTRRPVPGLRVEFTSTNASVARIEPRSGLLVALAPGTTAIVIDGGSAGTQTIRLTVRAQTPSPVVIVAAPLAATARTVAPATQRVVTPAPAAAAAPTTAATRTAAPDEGDVRSAVDRFITDVRRDAVRSFAVTQFLADGAEHRVMLVSGPTVVSKNALGVRVAFEIRLTKYDGGGRPVTRVSSVSMDVDNRDGQPASSAIAIGSLRRP